MRDDTLMNSTALATTINTNELNIEGTNAINMVAFQGKVGKGGMNLNTNQLNLVSQTNTHYEQHIEDDGGLLTITHSDKGEKHVDVVATQLYSLRSSRDREITT